MRYFFAQYNLIWCAKRDSNPHSEELVPKTSVSANSTTRAMVRYGGLEPPTNWLKANCSTIWANSANMVLAIGVEPTTYGLQDRCSTNWAKQAWYEMRGSNPRPSPCKGDALPAELISQKWWPMRDSNPRMHGWKPCVLTTSPMGQLALNTRLELVTCRLTAGCSTNWANSAKIDKC